MSKLLLLVLGSLLAMGCNGTVSDFVNGGGLPYSSLNPPVNVFQPPMSVRVSPGYVISTSSAVSMEAGIGPNRQVLQSSGVSAEITFNRTRVFNQ